MSSDTFCVTVLDSIAPFWQLWRVRGTGAGGANDFVSTRSFAFMALWELEQMREIRSRSSGVTVPMPLHSATKEPWDKAACEEHAATYINTLYWVGRVNEQPDDKWPEDVDLQKEGESLRQREDRLAERLHHVILSVEVKDPKYLADVPEVFGTTAFDVWWNDPMREPAPLFDSQDAYDGGIEEWLQEGKDFHASEGRL